MFTVCIAVVVSGYANAFLVYLATFSSIGLIVTYAPVVHPNHPLSAKRKQMHQKRARFLAALMGIFIPLVRLYSLEFASVMAFAFLTATLGMIVALTFKQAV
jgi:accessory gene regulator protein AgrB